MLNRLWNCHHLWWLLCGYCDQGFCLTQIFDTFVCRCLLAVNVALSFLQDVHFQQEEMGVCTWLTMTLSDCRSKQWRYEGRYYSGGLVTEHHTGHARIDCPRGQITIIIAANYPTSLLLSRNSIPLVKNAANKLNACGFPDHCPYFINKRHTFTFKALSVLFYDFRTFWLAFKEAHNLPTHKTPTKK